jgi:hypothetical protein
MFKMGLMKSISRLFVTSLLSFLASSVFGQSKDDVDRSASNLLVVLRESVGLNHTQIDLAPVGLGKFKLADGKEIEVEMAWYKYLGDMHIRFVFDGTKTMINATPADLKRLNLDATEALKVAVSNLRRTYGEPKVSKWDGELFQVQSKSPDLDSSYFLDVTFWDEQLKKYPDGLVVSVAKRGGLLFAPATDTRTVETLKKQVGYLHSSSERLRISSALFLVKDGKWTVYQTPSAK